MAELYWRSLSGDALAETGASGNTVNEYVFFAGRRVASCNNSGAIFYYFADQLTCPPLLAGGSPLTRGLILTLSLLLGWPGQVSADSGFFSLHNLEVMEERSIDGYVPDSNMARVLHHGGIVKQPTRHAALLRPRRKLSSATGRTLYRRRKALAEPVIGILKEQRGMRRFRMRRLGKVAAEFALATTALNLTRIWRLSPPGKRSA